MVHNTTENYTGVLNQKLSDITSSREFILPKKVLFTIIAVLAIVGNTLFCVVLVRKRWMLRRPYNKLLLSLSVTDLFTGIVIIFTPNFILDRDWLYVPDTIIGEFYCRIIYNRLLIFLFGKASILTATFLAVERWYSILKPIKYRLIFSRRRLWASIACIWISSLVLQLPKTFQISPYNQICKYHSSSADSQSLTIIYVSITFFLPSSIIWGTFAQIRKSIGKANRTKSNLPRRAASHRLLRVCALAACIMTLCWAPVQITYILSRFKIVRTSSILHQMNQMLAMVNSCINPWTFCLANKEYRDEVCALMTSVFSQIRTNDRKAVGHRSNIHSVELQTLPLRVLYFDNVQWMNNFEDKYSY